MPNAKQEFLQRFSNNENPKTLFEGAQLKYNASWEDKPWLVFTSKEYEAFLDWLDFSYDSGYGSQELFGFILLKGGAWLERHEYDGSERWVKKTRPHLDPLINDKE